MISTQEGFYTDKKKFKGGRGSFNVAFALISYDEADQTWQGDFSEYGEVKARLKKWGTGLNGTVFRDLETRNCTREDFKGDKNSLYYPVYEKHQATFDYYFDKLKCISEDFELYGDFDSWEASHLVI